MLSDVSDVRFAYKWARQIRYRDRDATSWTHLANNDGNQFHIPSPYGVQRQADPSTVVLLRDAQGRRGTGGNSDTGNIVIVFEGNDATNDL